MRSTKVNKWKQVRMSLWAEIHQDFNSAILVVERHFSKPVAGVVSYNATHDRNISILL